MKHNFKNRFFFSFLAAQELIGTTEAFWDVAVDRESPDAFSSKISIIELSGV